MWHYVAFRGKILETPNVAPKLTDQSCSNPTYSVLLQIFLAHDFAFDLSLELGVHITKNFIFSKMAQTILIKFCGFIVATFETQQYDNRLFRKNLCK